MIKLRERWVTFLRGDLSFNDSEGLYAPDEKSIPIFNLMEEALSKITEDNPLVKSFCNDSIYIRLTSYKINKKNKTIILLWTIGDKNTTDPMYWDTVSNKYRSTNRKKSEVVGYSSHTVFIVDAKVKNSLIILQEKTPDFTKNRLQAMMTSIIKNGQDCEIKCNISNLPSKSLSDIISGGKLLEANVIRSGNVNEQIDEGWDVQREDRRFIIKARDVTPMNATERLKSLLHFAKEKKCNLLSIRYRENESTRTISFEPPEDEFAFDLGMFDRIEKISVSSPISQIIKKPHKELVKKMQQKLLKLTYGNDKDVTYVRECSSTEATEFSTHKRAQQLTLL